MEETTTRQPDGYLWTLEHILVMDFRLCKLLSALKT